MKNIAIIGAGIGGLATAIRLKAKGYDVEVFEKQSLPGGKLMELHSNGFRFDLGPSLFTQPEQVEELFSLCGEKCADFFRYHRLEKICRYFWPDGASLDVPSDPLAFAAEVERTLGESRTRLSGYLDASRNLYIQAAPLFLERPFPTLEAMMSREGKRIGKNPWILDPFKSLHNRNQNYFKDKRLIQLFDRYATYNGSDPYRAPATLKMIAHLEHNLGAFFPEKGMYSIATELTSLAERQGVRFHYNSPVEKILLNRKRKAAIGIRVNGTEQFFDALVSDVDINTLYRSTILNVRMPRLGRNQQLSSSAFIFYWGVTGIHPGLDLHNILFSGNYREEFRHIFDTKTVYEDPTIYIFISSRQVPDDAPDGHENWFVMINTPENTGQDWDRLIPEIRAMILDKVCKITGINIADRIIFEHVEDPRTIETRTGSWHGSLYGNSSNSRMSAFSRHPNRRRRIKNLYFTGGSVHPGGGIPLCLASAQIVSNLLTD